MSINVLFQIRFLVRFLLILLSLLPRRLGCVVANGGEEAIKKHPFFNNKIDWIALEERKLKPPFRPRTKDEKDTSNFDKDFTSEEPVLTPIDPIIVKAINQDEFRDFSFVNPDWKSGFTTSVSSQPNVKINNTSTTTTAKETTQQQQQQAQLSSSSGASNEANTSNLITPSISFPQPLTVSTNPVNGISPSSTSLQNHTLQTSIDDSTSHTAQGLATNETGNTSNTSSSLNLASSQSKESHSSNNSISDGNTTTTSPVSQQILQNTEI